MTLRLGSIAFERQVQIALNVRVVCCRQVYVMKERGVPMLLRPESLCDNLASLGDISGEEMIRVETSFRKQVEGYESISNSLSDDRR